MRVEVDGRGVVPVHVLQNVAFGTAQPFEGGGRKKQVGSLDPMDTTKPRDEMSPRDAHPIEPKVLKTCIGRCRGMTVNKAFQSP